MSFTTKIVSKLTGLTQRQIDYWDRTHFVKPSLKEAAGYGSGRPHKCPASIISIRTAL